MPTESISLLAVSAFNALAALIESAVAAALKESVSVPLSVFVASLQAANVAEIARIANNFFILREFSF